MELQCGVCGGKITLCKYYPSENWYLFSESMFMDRWLAEHAHEGPSQYGPTHFTMDYETKEENA